ncbi:MAG: hypothetical protein RI885_1329 [Actinomycetota bacterium]
MITGDPTRSASGRVAGYALAPRVVQTIAGLALVVTGLRVNIAQEFTAGTFVSAALLPLWWPVLARYRGARLLFGLTLLALASGLWLTELSRSDHEISVEGIATGSAALLGVAASLGLIIWAREHLTDGTVAVLFGIGMLGSIVIRERGLIFDGDAWKFGLATAVTVTALGVAGRRGRRLLEVAILVVILGVTLVSDARSYSAIILLTLIVTVIQFRPDRHDRRASALRLSVVIVGAAALVYSIGQTLILDGYLGSAAQERTAAQIDVSGSLILGGRPEIAASAALLQDRPWGFGVGALPTLADITVAKTGMAAIGYQPNNGYVENYMFGNGFELHSLLGDLWVAYGIPGLALAAAIVVICVITLSKTLAVNRASALLVFLVVNAFWNFLFSPIYSSLLTLMLLVGLVVQRAGPKSGPLSDGDAHSEAGRSARSVSRIREIG